MLDAATVGQGLAWVLRDLAEKHLNDGSLVDVLEPSRSPIPVFTSYATPWASSTPIQVVAAEV
jgi:hypothetical protein